MSRDNNAPSENISPLLYYKTFTQSTLDMTKSLFKLILSYVSLSIEVYQSLLNKGLFFLEKNCNLQYRNDYLQFIKKMNEKSLEIDHLTKTSKFRQIYMVGGMPPFFKWSLGFVKGFVGGEKMTQFWRDTMGLNPIPKNIL